MKRKRQLGDLQLAIMRVLWERGEAPAIEVHQALFEERRLAVTTIKTMLRKLEEYGCVE
ncbi:MAG: BlaI/MecI/CopY family transcriptional regulator, partial [Gammaproteobacteria bacterium]|nr:BlaI/MecI/CopY family transcriptional regulator [Gammaproteobacteria bacterium]